MYIYICIYTHTHELDNAQHTIQKKKKRTCALSSADVASVGHFWRLILKHLCSEKFNVFSSIFSISEG